MLENLEKVGNFVMGWKVLKIWGKTKHLKNVVSGKDLIFVL